MPEKALICPRLTSVIYNIHNRLATLQKSETVSNFQARNVAFVVLADRTVFPGVIVKQRTDFCVGARLTFMLFFFEHSIARFEFSGLSV